MERSDEIEYQRSNSREVRRSTVELWRCSSFVNEDVSKVFAYLNSPTISYVDDVGLAIAYRDGENNRSDNNYKIGEIFFKIFKIDNHDKIPKYFETLTSGKENVKLVLRASRRREPIQCD